MLRPGSAHRTRKTPSFKGLKGTQLGEHLGMLGDARKLGLSLGGEDADDDDDENFNENREGEWDTGIVKTATLWAQVSQQEERPDPPQGAAAPMQEKHGQEGWLPYNGRKTIARTSRFPGANWSTPFISSFPPLLQQPGPTSYFWPLARCGPCRYFPIFWRMPWLWGILEGGS